MVLTRLFRITLFAYLLLASASAAAGQYSFDTWTTDNGLPQNGVRQITQTPDGYLWFTTFDGLVRFDGVRFTTFNKSNTKGIINNRFTGIFADTDGTVFATTMEDGVLTMYRNGEFTSLTSDQVPGNYISRIERSGAGQLRMLIEDGDRKGRSWYSFSRSKFEFIERDIQPTADLTFTGLKGSTWEITAKGVTESRNGLSVFTPADLSKTNFRRNAFEDASGSLWLSENKVFNFHDGKLQTFSDAAGLPQDSLYHSFWQEADGSVWFSSGGASSASIGLVEYKNGQFKLWGKEHGLAAAAIQDIFHDREGNTWLATVKGLSRRRKNVIESYSIKDGLRHSEVYPLYRDSKNTIWIGTSRGLSAYRNGKFEAVDLEAVPTGNPTDLIWRNDRMSVQALFEDQQGTMWVGLNGGIFLVADGKAKMLLNGSHVHSIKDDTDGNIWAATNKGLLKFRDRKLIAQYTTSDGLPNEFMTTIFRDSKNAMWFGGFGGLTKLENGIFVNYAKTDGLAGNYIRAIYEDKEGVMWIGTYDEGLSRFKDGKFVSYHEENGLYSSGVFAIEEDEKGNFWISSNRGIYRVKRDELNDFADGKIAKINSVGYGKRDGMLTNECNGGRQPASLRDDQGRFWFPTQDGISIVDPRREEANPFPPTVAIEEVTVEREPVTANGSVVIEPGKRDLEIHYTGISLIKSDQVKFQYKLEGHDKDWVDAGTQRTAHYSYLPPGDYKFLVKAANSDGVWAEQPAVLGVELKPFFYQTWTFLALAIGAIGLVLFAIWRLSVYQLRARERKLARLVEERTAELAKANEDLHRLANSDGLTKIGNRRRFESFLADEWHRAVRFRTEISLVMIDIDHFKQFNDTYGHQAGDECLQKVAEAFADAIKRPTDLVARFGGEEFALVLGGTDSEGAVTIAREALANLRELEIQHASSPIGEFLTVSLGVATVLPRIGSTEADLIKVADEALYLAKKTGRDRMQIFDEMTHGPMNAIRATHEMFHRPQA
ncbi:MAG: diguanylate cyclase [Pyrinomonadaceae bacterium]